MDQVRRALMTRLAGETAITTLLPDGADGIHHRLAPVDAAEPMVVFQRTSGSDLTGTFGPDRWEGQMWLVKGVAQGESASVAEDLSDRIDNLLHDNMLPVAGQVVHWLRRESRVDFEEQDGQERWHHAGGLFRLIVGDP